ncbi:DUF192 domain-containing protein [Petroclostridium sp. X23]|uniref:DUF192 domain-containing protein n=1 Tax=Petroclostridium sp. X23 TaxID=3045146 RepID=UPI0024ADD7C8|nr:DUF192 domain-containing protein [Petroclostridium sp. X23]WHH57943.1 DUF192 domain-containing protein [Petroclostridium sp. X23]
MYMHMYENSGRFQVKAEWMNTFAKRLKGLMFRSVLPPGQGILLFPCSGIHTCFMRFPIDAVYLDDGFTVLGKETVIPWRVGKHVKGAKMILETSAGVAAQLETGMRFIVRIGLEELVGRDDPCNQDMNRSVL